MNDHDKMTKLLAEIEKEKKKLTKYEAETVRIYKIWEKAENKMNESEDRLAALEFERDLRLKWKI